MCHNRWNTTTWGYLLVVLTTATNFYSLSHSVRNAHAKCTREMFRKDLCKCQPTENESVYIPFWSRIFHWEKVSENDKSKKIKKKHHDNEIPLKYYRSPCIQSEINPSSGLYIPSTDKWIILRAKCSAKSRTIAQVYEISSSVLCTFQCGNMIYTYRTVQLFSFVIFVCSKSKSTNCFFVVVCCCCWCCAQMANENNSLSKLNEYAKHFEFERSVARCAMARVSAWIYICDNIKMLCHAPKPIQLIYNSNI